MMRLVLGSGRHRRTVEFPTGRKVGVTQLHVDQMCRLLKVASLGEKASAA